MGKRPVISISLALYDESWRGKAHDRLGIRVRVTRKNTGPGATGRDYYPSAALLNLMKLPELAWNYFFMSFEMKGKIRLSIGRKPPSRYGHYDVTGIYVTMPYEEAQRKGYVPK